jgi:hypothetical protein
LFQKLEHFAHKPRKETNMPKGPDLEIDAADLMQKYQLVVRVKKFGRVAFRFRIVGVLMAIASRIAPCEFWLSRSTETCEAGYACGDVDPYGFVPECGCPIHDPDDPDEMDDPSGSEFNDFVERSHHGD